MKDGRSSFTPQQGRRAVSRGARLPHRLTADFSDVFWRGGQFSGSCRRCIRPARHCRGFRVVRAPVTRSVPEPGAPTETEATTTIARSRQGAGGGAGKFKDSGGGRATFGRTMWAPSLLLARGTQRLPR
ncbi:hypothetical protein MRX96_014348 [Rhipicephalus microplus]